MTRTAVRSAVLLRAGAPLELRELHLDDPLPGEVRVRTLAAGLCHSDLHYADGTLPIELPAVLGHEVIGEISAVGDERSAHRIGERVIATITPSCGSCARCVAGSAAQCLRAAQVRQRSRPKLVDGEGRAVQLLGSIGGFADQFLLPEAAAVPLGDGIPDAEGCLLGCCVATGFGAVVHGAAVGPLDAVAVIGCGGVGVAAIQAARIAGARRIIAIDLHPEKLERARGFGATDVLRSGDDLVRRVHEICPGGVDKSFEAVGSPATAALAFEMLASNGVATVLGLERPGSAIALNAELLIEGDRRIQGAYMGANQLPRDIPSFEAHYRAGALQLDRMVTSRWSFEQINEGFAAMADPDAIRAVVEW
ncbi:zinc-binding dehydrogenase [Leucobacter weissii]|uniref:Zinc-binding dehydrogenase n=1 Tax=Leucobacter weissii TaxID=1983706 RepID=A0A939MP42_9MICO|nr:zinc-binding dehydrogenase [Leucobacter weissii]MBO1902152.1 zinc-binding dehydrogenase [Leucobacter weissii]